MLWLELRRHGPDTLSRQLYRQLVDKILGGELPGGTRLPSSRELAAEHRIARNIVVAVFEQLLAEGYLEARAGSGTYIAQLRRPRPAPVPSAPAAEATPTPEPRRDGTVSFICGSPDVGLVPRARWLSCLRHVGFFRAAAMWDYAPPAGSPALRAEIAAHLRRAKGIDCTPGQIVVTAGTTAALTFVAHLLKHRRPGALVEDPVVGFVPALLAEAGHTIAPVPADASGFVVEKLPAKPRAGMVFVSPAHQFPLGATLPIPRRLALVDYARRHRLLIVEDDYDSEFRHEGAPVDSLCRLAPERVLHLGTFSKCLAPALRLGYVVLPAALVPAAVEAAETLHLGVSRYTQEAMARFIGQGHLGRHIARMQRLYRRRMLRLRSALRARFGDAVAISGHSTGLHLVATFRGVRFDSATRARLSAHGVAADAVDAFALGRPRHPGALALGYGHLPLAEIDEGARRLAAALGES